MLQQIGYSLPPRRAGESEGDIRLDGEMGKEAALLWYVADLAMLGVNVCALGVDEPARRS